MKGIFIYAGQSFNLLFQSIIFLFLTSFNLSQATSSDIDFDPGVMAPPNINISACVNIASQAIADQYRNTIVRVTSQIQTCMVGGSHNIGGQDVLIQLNGTTGLQCSKSSRKAVLAMPAGQSNNPCSPSYIRGVRQNAQFVVRYIFPRNAIPVRNNTIQIALNNNLWWSAPNYAANSPTCQLNSQTCQDLTTQNTNVQMALSPLGNQNYNLIYYMG